MSFDQILEIIQSQNPLIIYVILVGSAFLEIIFPPYPGDSVTLAGAFLAGDGNLNYIAVLISVTTGGIIGAMILYYIGREKGRSYFEKSDNKFFGRKNLVKVDQMFLKYGATLILFSRFMAGIRSAIALGAGLGDVRPSKMILLTVLSNLLWNAFLIGLMYYTQSNWQMISNLVGKYHVILVTIIAVLLAVWAIKLLWKKRTN